MLVEEIKKRILSEHLVPGQKLPSIRKLAQSLGVSTGSIAKVYQDLVNEGLVKSYPGKGFIFGNINITDNFRIAAETLDSLFLKDMQNGYLDVLSSLPSLKELASHYKTSTYHIRKFITQKVEQGFLKKIGTNYSFCTEPHQVKQKFILMVHRSDAKGHLLIESEREQEAFRTLATTAQEQNITVQFIGYHEPSKSLLSPEGLPFTPQNNINCLGAFLSTWLIDDPTILFNHFAKFESPISVWWEHSAQKYPKSTRNNKKWAFFNLAFSEDSGFAVGQYLKDQGITKASYVSPFHMADWSKKRLEGLLQSGIETEILVDTQIFSPHDAIIKAKGLNISANDYIKEIVSELIKKASTSVFVGANDWISAIILQIFEEKGQKRPYVIGFDNSMESFRYSFDSFSFNVEVMVKEALYHIISPSLYANFKSLIQNPQGKVIKKTPFLVKKRQF